MTPAGRIARDAAAINTATDNSEVENPLQDAPPGARQFTLAISLSVWNKSQPNAKASEKEKLGFSGAKHGGGWPGRGCVKASPALSGVGPPKL